jgi:hypothetical protein
MIQTGQVHPENYEEKRLEFGAVIIFRQTDIGFIATALDLEPSRRMAGDQQTSQTMKQALDGTVKSYSLINKYYIYIGDLWSIVILDLTSKQR